MFFIFNRACKKYKFTYMLNTNNGFSLILRPSNSFNEAIEVKQEYYECNYFKLFLKAIKAMKTYKKGSERP